MNPTKNLAEADAIAERLHDGKPWLSSHGPAFAAIRRAVSPLVRHSFNPFNKVFDQRDDVGLNRPMTAQQLIAEGKAINYKSFSESLELGSFPLFFFDGSQDWVIVYNDEVAGSSPAYGPRCRGSSVVEHVFPVRFLSVVNDGQL